MKPNNLVRDINIGRIIQLFIHERDISYDSLRVSFGCSKITLNKMLNSKSLDTIVLLKWCKVLRYDFFRLYSSHLMLHHGISNSGVKRKESVSIEGINIRKNVYTMELIVFLITKVRKGELTSMEVIKKYSIPKTTFYKWLQKYPDI